MNRCLCGASAESAIHQVDSTNEVIRLAAHPFQVDTRDADLEMWRALYGRVAAKWAAVLDAAGLSEEAQPDEVVAALRENRP